VHAVIECRHIKRGRASLTWAPGDPSPNMTRRMAATISRSTSPTGATYTLTGAAPADVVVPDMETTGSAASAAASAADLARS
jgi:hypothetical protein